MTATAVLYAKILLRRARVFNVALTGFVSEVPANAVTASRATTVPPHLCRVTGYTAMDTAHAVTAHASAPMIGQVRGVGKNLQRCVSTWRAVHMERAIKESASAQMRGKGKTAAWSAPPRVQV